MENVVVNGGEPGKKGCNQFLSFPKQKKKRTIGLQTFTGPRQKPKKAGPRTFIVFKRRRGALKASQSRKEFGLNGLGSSFK